MGQEILIRDEELGGFTDQAALDLKNAIVEYKRDLLGEIGRIEAGQSGSSDQPEITSRMVQDAQLRFARGPLFKAKRRFAIFLKVVAMLSLFVAGALADKDFLQGFGDIVFFLAIAAVAILTNTLIFLRE